MVRAAKDEIKVISQVLDPNMPSGGRIFCYAGRGARAAMARTPG
jgi:hypothetical protein